MKLFVTLDTNGKHNFLDVLPSIVTNTFVFYYTFSEQKKTLNVKYALYTISFGQYVIFNICVIYNSVAFQDFVKFMNLGNFHSQKFRARNLQFREAHYSIK